MKYLIVVAVVGIVLWWMFGRQRSAVERPPARPGRGRRAVPIVECVHCRVHLPRDEAVIDGAGRLYCSDAHRLAGPR